MTKPSPAPRIAYLTGEYPAVSHTFILREVLALRALGLDVETCSIRKTGPEHQRGPAEKDAARSTFYVLEAAKSPLRLIGAHLDALIRSPGRYARALRLAWRSSAPGWRAHLWQMFYFAEAGILARHLRRTGITRLHNHFAGPSATVSMLTSEMTGIPFSFTLHGPADLEDVHRWKLREKIARADMVSCISYYARSQAMLHSDPEHWDKLRIIHCGVSPATYAPTTPTETVPTGAGTALVFVGRLAPVKGLRILMEAFAAAHAHRPELTLTLVGDGSDRALLEQLAAPLGAAVRFTGYQSQQEVAEILAASDALVLPSFAEGVPVVLMEAMASGKPVIATRITGVGELVEDGVSGFLVAPGNPTELCERILDLSAPDTPRAQMGAAGQARVRAEFDIDSEAARLAALFRGTGGADPRPDPVQGPA